MLRWIIFDLTTSSLSRSQDNGFSVNMPAAGIGSSDQGVCWHHHAYLARTHTLLILLHPVIFGYPSLAQTQSRSSVNVTMWILYSCCHFGMSEVAYIRTVLQQSLHQEVNASLWVTSNNGQAVRDQVLVHSAPL